MSLRNATDAKLRQYKKKIIITKKMKEKRKPKAPLPSDSNHIVILNLLEFTL